MQLERTEQIHCTWNRYLPVIRRQLFSQLQALTFRPKSSCICAGQWNASHRHIAHVRALLGTTVKYVNSVYRSSCCCLCEMWFPAAAGRTTRFDGTASDVSWLHMHVVSRLSARRVAISSNARRACRRIRLRRARSTLIRGTKRRHRRREKFGGNWSAELNHSATL